MAALALRQLQRLVTHAAARGLAATTGKTELLPPPTARRAPDWQKHECCTDRTWQNMGRAARTASGTLRCCWHEPEPGISQAPFGEADAQTAPKSGASGRVLRRNPASPYRQKHPHQKLGRAPPNGPMPTGKSTQPRRNGLAHLRKVVAPILRKAVEVHAPENAQNDIGFSSGVAGGYAHMIFSLCSSLLLL